MVFCIESQELILVNSWYLKYEIVSDDVRRWLNNSRLRCLGEVAVVRATGSQRERRAAQQQATFEHANTFGVLADGSAWSQPTPSQPDL